MSPKVARTGPSVPVWRCPLFGEYRKSRFEAARSESDLGCVKTCASRECAELFTPLSALDRDCQCCCFPIQRNRDKISSCKFDIGVFTQAGPAADVATGQHRPEIRACAASWTGSELP